MAIVNMKKMHLLGLKKRERKNPEESCKKPA